MDKGLESSLGNEKKGKKMPNGHQRGVGGGFTPPKLQVAVLMGV